VQLGEFVDSQGDARFPVSGSSEDYVGSRVWFEVLFVREGEFYCAIIENFVPGSAANDLEVQVHATHRNGSMLGDVTKVVQNGERMEFRPLNSVVRLQRLDFFPSSVRKALCEPSEVLGSTLIPTDDGREFGTGVRGIGFQGCKFPSQMVEREPQVADEIGEHEAKPIWWRRNLESDFMRSLLRVDFLLGKYRVSFGELSEFSVEIVQVFLRPVELGSWSIK
jgi:hypothetical protein